MRGFYALLLVRQSRCVKKNGKTFKFFMHIMLSYSKMSAEQFGFDTNYKAADDSPFVPSKFAQRPKRLLFKDHQFKLDEKLLFFQPAIVSRGTLCWLAED